MHLDNHGIHWKIFSPEGFSKNVPTIYEMLHAKEVHNANFFAVALLKSYDTFSPEDKKKLKTKFDQLQVCIMNIHRQLYQAAQLVAKTPQCKNKYPDQIYFRY